MASFTNVDPKNIDLFDFNGIYNERYSYSLPKQVLETWFEGKGFDYDKAYTNEELSKLKADIQDIWNRIVAKPLETNQRVAILSAGAPGAGKSTVLERIRKDLNTESPLAQYAYICPDSVCLTSMTQTYQADIKAKGKTQETLAAAYTKWRPGSNAATHIILANLIKHGFSFFFGTTCSSDKTPMFFQFLQKNSYRIEIIHVSAPDDVRWESIQRRDQEFIQSTEKDVREKGLLVPQRINDFLKYASNIDFYYRAKANGDATLAAQWQRDKELRVLDAKAYANAREEHNRVIYKVDKPQLSWKNTVEKPTEEESKEAF